MASRSSLLLGWACVLLAGSCFPATGAEPSRVDEVIIAFKTHFDLGYTDMASNVVQRYRTTMIDKALDVVDQSRSAPAQAPFVWTIPGWPLAKMMEDWPGQTAERRQRLGAAFHDGRFVVHALPFTTHTELLEPEDLVRGLGYASSLSRAAGLPLPRDAKMTDVPCHSWFLPTLLHRAGVDFLHLGCNPASRSPRVPLLFWWEGPDGSRVLTVYSEGGYGSELHAPRNWPYRTWLALIHTGDNHGPPTPDEVKKLLATANQELPGVKVRIGRLSDFADALRHEKAQIPVIRGDMPDTWIHGPLSDPQGASLARHTRPQIMAAEALGTELSVWGRPTPDFSTAVQRAWEQSLLYGEHTWGGALSWVYQYSQKTAYAYGDDWKTLAARGHFNRIESSWEEHSTYIRRAAQIISPVLADELQSLAQAVSINGPRIVVFNPLPWPRRGVVRLESTPFAAASLRMSDGKQHVEIEQDGTAFQFVSPEVPALGYLTLVPDNAPSDQASLEADQPQPVIENPSLRLTIDPQRGGIVRIVDRRTQRELLAPTAPYSLGQFLYERFDADQVAGYVRAYVKSDADWAVTELGKPNLPPAREKPYRASSPPRFTTAVRRSAVQTEVTLHAAPGEGVPFPVTTKIMVPATEPWFEIEVTVHDKPADPWPEAGWICLPVQAEQPEFRLGRQAGVTDPARDIVPGANRDLFAVNTGLTIRDTKGRGLGLCPQDHAVVSLGQPGCWRYSLADFPRKPIAFVNLFNNQWTTNFRLWNSGTVRSRVRVWTTSTGQSLDQALQTPAAEARQPLLAAAATGAAGTLPTKRQGLWISRPGAAVTAFGPNPDGEGLVLRLWERGGKSGSCAVHLPEGLTIASVQPVNLRGVPNGDPIPVRNGRFTCKLPAFAPSSFVLKP